MYLPQKGENVEPALLPDEAVIESISPAAAVEGEPFTLKVEVCCKSGLEFGGCEEVFVTVDGVESPAAPLAEGGCRTERFDLQMGSGDRTFRVEVHEGGLLDPSAGVTDARTHTVRSVSTGGEAFVDNLLAEVSQFLSDPVNLVATMAVATLGTVLVVREG